MNSADDTYDLCKKKSLKYWLTYFANQTINNIAKFILNKIKLVTQRF